MTTTTTPTMATGLIREATSRHPTTTAPMAIAQDCHGAIGRRVIPEV